MMSIDGNLLNEFFSGNREAIKVVSATIARQLTSNGLQDKELAAALVQILRRIGEGESPNDAFGWKQAGKGRPKGVNAFRDWDIRMTVQQRMKNGESNRQACLNVSSDADGEFYIPAKSIETICEGLTDTTPLEFPDNLYPLGDTESYRKSPPLEIKSRFK